MHVAFDPPLGQIARVATPSDISSVTLTFTAEVGADDYAAILNDGGRVQLWTDLPIDGAYNGAWQEAQFIQAEIPPLTASNPNDISINARQAEEDTIILTAGIKILLRTLSNKVFQFTYRIKYDRGQVHWFGNFDMNGSLVWEDMEGMEERFTLSEGWVKLEHGSWVFQSESECVQKIVGRTDVSRYRVWSLGGDILLPEPKGASMLFLIPRCQKSMVPIPTYILSASPTLAITLLADDAIAISGTGSLAIQIPGPPSDTNEELKRLFRRSGLNNWHVLASDAQSHSVVIGSNSCPELLQTAAFPLWSSPWFRHSVRVPYSNITDIVSQVSTHDIAIFSSYKLQIWVLRDESMLESISFMYNSTGDSFVIAPLHPLTKPEFNQASELWAASIFSRHRSLNTPHHLQTLPTPPPSPKLIYNTVSPRMSIPSNPTSSGRIAPQPKSPSSMRGYASYFSWVNHYTPPAVLGIFKSIFTSLSIFLRVFCRVFGGRFQKPSTSHSSSAQSSNNVMQFLHDDKNLLMNCSMDMATSSDGSSSIAYGNAMPPNVNPPEASSPPMEDGKLVAELQYTGDCLNAATLTVALVPLSLEVDHHTFHESGIERSVVFMDDSNLECAVSKCSVVFVRGQTGHQPNIVEGSGSLLEYKVDGQNSRSNRVIEVLSPL